MARLAEADELLERKRPREALALLRELESRYPNHEDVLTLLVNAHFDLGDLRGYQIYAERLIRFRPDDPDLLLALAGAYSVNVYPALSVHTFHRFLERFPDHPKARELREDLPSLEAALDRQLIEMGLTGDDRLELAVLHDQARAGLETGNFQQGRQIARRLLKRQPDFAPAHNNLSIIDFAEGNQKQAIERAGRVLKRDPDNYQALGNLTRFLYLTGQPNEARGYLDRLLALDQDDVELAWKQAETLAYLGEDQAMLDVYEQAKARGYLASGLANPTLYHFAAVAALRLGDEKRARKLWRKALKVDPGFELARGNLEDLDRPVEERHAPWPFTFKQWLPTRVFEDIVRQWDSASSTRGKRTGREAALHLLKRHPEVGIVVPILLDRGDPAGREFALNLALLARTPELLAALQDFATGQRGPDDMRLEAARAVGDAGLLPRAPVSMWIKGKWCDIVTMTFHISWEPTKLVSPEISELQVRAGQALSDGQPAEAEQLLLQALELAPDSPELLNNLAVAYHDQGRQAEAEALIRQIHEDHPDYFFASTALANMAVMQGDYARAHDLLGPLTNRETLHISEFETLCISYIQLGMAQRDSELVQGWLNMWEALDPDSQKLRIWRKRARSIRSRFLR